MLLRWKNRSLLRFDAAEVPGLGYAKLAGNDLVKVETSSNPNGEIEQEHQNTAPERVTLVHVRHLCQGQPIGGVQVVEEYELYALVHAHIWENAESILQSRTS